MTSSRGFGSRLSGFVAYGDMRNLLLVVLIGAIAAAPSPYSAMAPIGAYHMDNADEIALALSAAPPSVAKDAKVLVFGASGYSVARKGTNGFVCLVQRSWGNAFDDAEFWNPKVRVPVCMNEPAARSVVPEYLMRTQWVLAHATREQILARAKAAITAGKITAPETGSMAYMLSKHGNLADKAGPWHPHVMFFYPKTSAAMWDAEGADTPISPLIDAVEPITTVLVPVAKWSDGTPYIPHAKH